jgi:glycerol-3-phosphate dehydrogenase
MRARRCERTRGPIILDSDYDLIVIGAGINGTGIARDAAMRGLKVLLVDKGDIGGGTSSWSTRLIHGGLRYLEHGEFGLVRESLRERETLMRIAPHLVRSLPILVPIYKDARRGLWTMRAGMWAYDLLSLGKRLPRHRLLSRKQVLQEAPALEPEGLEGAALYYDAQVEFAERLVVENALSAVENGAAIITYAHVNNFIVENGVVRGVELNNEIEGGIQRAGARMFVNAAGPWVDDVLKRGVNQIERIIGGTKGSHIILGPFESAPKTAIYVEAQTDGRPFFIIPWNNKYLIGTTDIRFDGNLDDVSIDGREIDYLLRETNRVLPHAKLGREHILYTYSGVRPLSFTGETNEQRITRRHFIRRHPKFENLLSIVGGKLTTYRSLAEEAVDLIFKKVGKRSPKCTTAKVSLPGNANADLNMICQNFRQLHSVSAFQRDRLLRIYGERAVVLMELLHDEPALGAAFDSETGALGAEIVFSFKQEFAQTLADCLLRRTMVGLNSTCGLDAAEAAAEVGRKYLGWTDNRSAREINDYRKTIARCLQNRSRSK